MVTNLKTSVVIPTGWRLSLKYLLDTLNSQTKKPTEVILIGKQAPSLKKQFCLEKYNLNILLLNQVEGYVSHAYNMGIKASKGEIILFTDDDAIPGNTWIEQYLYHYQKSPHNIGCISSRDKYVDLNGSLKPTPDDLIYNQMYRWLVATWYKPPHSLLKKYRMGLYISSNYEATHGPYIPNRRCFSLPFRGVNMSFRKDALKKVAIPEHPTFKRAFGFEQHMGIQLIQKGFDCIYVPDNSVLHLVNHSLSRTIDKKDLRVESQFIKGLCRELLET